MAAVKRIRPAGLVHSPAFSHAAIVPAGASTIYVSGQNGVGETGRLVGSSATAQAARAVDNAILTTSATDAPAASRASSGTHFMYGVDLDAAYGLIAPRLGTTSDPPPV